MGCFQKHSAFVVVFSLALLLTCEAAATSRDPSSSSPPQARKLLNFGGGEPPHGGGTGQHYSTTIMGPNDCSEEDVWVSQDNAKPLPNGIPTYNVEITNTCLACRVSNVHIACGEFASTEIIDPTVFQRVSINDCVVKGGAPMEPGEIIPFSYANSFQYPLKVASVSCGQ